MVHFLKIKAEYLHAIIRGEKRFEARKNDRDFKNKDYIVFRCIDGQIKDTAYAVKITYILDDPEYVKEGYVILSIMPVNDNDVLRALAINETDGEIK